MGDTDGRYGWAIRTAAPTGTVLVRVSVLFTNQMGFFYLTCSYKKAQRVAVLANIYLNGHLSNVQTTHVYRYIKVI